MFEVCGLFGIHILLGGAQVGEILTTTFSPKYMYQYPFTSMLLKKSTNDRLHNIFTKKKKRKEKTDL